jgi:hypothetical protein
VTAPSLKEKAEWARSSTYEFRGSRFEVREGVFTRNSKLEPRNSSVPPAMEIPACVRMHRVAEEPDEHSISAHAAVVLARIRDIPLAARHTVRTCGFDEIVPCAGVTVADRDLVVAALLGGDGDGAGWGEELEDQLRLSVSSFEFRVSRRLTH